MMDGLYGSLFIRRKKGTAKPWAMISNAPSDIQAMGAANDPKFVVISDWTQYDSEQYMMAQKVSKLQIL
jgi:hypothetical protein